MVPRADQMALSVIPRARGTTYRHPGLFRPVVVTQIDSLNLAFSTFPDSVTDR